MKLVEKDNEIILKDIPWENWTRGVLSVLGFILFGVAALGKPGKPASEPVDMWQIFSLFIALVALYWAYRKLSLPATVTRIKPAERTVEVTTRRFLLIKKTARIPFSQIKRFEVVKRKPDRAFLYFNVLTLRDGSQIDLEADGNAVEGTINIIPVRFNEYLKNLKDESGGKIG